MKMAKPSAFSSVGLRKSVALLVTEIATLYESDHLPWIVGYSGGKDSTAALQFVWLALSRIDASRRTKPVHVISTDTLVENPIVSAWVARSLDVMKTLRDPRGIPIVRHTG